MACLRHNPTMEPLARSDLPPPFTTLDEYLLGHFDEGH